MRVVGTTIEQRGTIKHLQPEKGSDRQPRSRSKGERRRLQRQYHGRLATESRKERRSMERVIESRRWRIELVFTAVTGYQPPTTSNCRRGLLERGEPPSRTSCKRRRRKSRVPARFKVIGLPSERRSRQGLAHAAVCSLRSRWRVGLLDPGDSQQPVECVQPPPVTAHNR